MRCDRIWTNARLATLDPRRCGLGVVPHGLVACSNGRIVFAGHVSEAPADLDGDRIDLDGRWMTPGLIDCHTHLVHGGHRAQEFAQRLAGATYEDIARAGGGIVSTVTATRAATETALIESAVTRLDALIAEGVTTVEVKSGYGLDLDTEVKQLRATHALGEVRRVTIVPTFLGAHAVPRELAGHPDRYVDLVCHAMLPYIATERLAMAVDAFCDDIAFSRAQVARVFDAARAHGLALKLHADQRSNGHGAALAARFGALSADHLEYTDEDGVRALAAAGSTAVLLPGAYYVLRETRTPPVDALRTHGVPMAVATDCNPGTSPLTSLLLAMNMAAVCFGLTTDECLAGVTREAARALGLVDRIGTLEPGKWCDLAIWNVDQPEELVYRIGFNPLHTRVWRGQ